MGYLVDLIRTLLLYFYNLTGNFGVAIILLTIVTRIILYPLYMNQAKYSAKTKEIQPKMKEIQQKYKDNPQEQQKRTLELYREYKYNPLARCLPLPIQMPFIWAIFYALREFPGNIPAEAFAQPFSATFLFWNLLVADPTYILPILSGATTFWSMSQTATDPSQRTMLMVMPIFLVVISATFSAGLVLYWTIGNLLSVAQQLWFHRQNSQKRGSEA